MGERHQLEQAIAALEQQRATLGDSVVDLSIAALKRQLAEMKPEPMPEVRKLVTVLVSDLVDFTAMAQHKDPEEVHAILRRYFKLWESAIDRYHGVISGYAGDGLIAVFGFPAASERDAENAIRAALEMRDTLPRFNQQLKRQHGIRLSMRVGINTGPAFLGGINQDDDFTITGDIVNLASRLEHLAPVNGIRISQSCYSHVRGVFDVLVQEPIRIKGKSEPVHTCIVEQTKAHMFRQTRLGVEGIETRMVGRDTELDALQGFFHNTATRARPRIVLVSGEAGIGKSRLLYEFNNWLELLPERIWYFKGLAASDLQTVPFSLIRSVFAFRFGIQESDSVAIAMTKFRAETKGILEPDQADLVGHLIGFDFSSSEAVRNLTGSSSFGATAKAYLFRYLRVMTESQPMVMLLEDLHWADDNSLELVRELSAALPDAPLLIVGLARPTLFERHPDWDRENPSLTRLQIKPLEPSACFALVGEILRKMDRIPGLLRTLIVDKTEGNPLYVEEMIKMMIEDEVILPGRDCWRVVPDRLVETRVPPTLTSIVQARMDSLPKRERKLLQIASVVGRSFWDAAIVELADDPDTALDLAAELDSLCRRELIYRNHPSAFRDATEYTFKHAILRDVIYETVLLKQRRAYHRRAAAWLESRTAQRIGEFLGRIAEHYAHAGESARAASYLQRAGEQAIRISAYRQSPPFLERVLSILSPMPGTEQELGRVHLTIGEAYWYLGEFPTATRHLETALEIATGRDRTADRANSLYWLGQVANSQGDYRSAQALLEQGLALARKAVAENGARSRATLARLLYGMGDMAWRLGDLDATSHHVAESLPVARAIGDTSQVLFALNRLGAVAYGKRQLAEAERLYEECRQLAVTVGNREMESTALTNLAEVAEKRGDLQHARHQTRAALEIARELHGQEWIAMNLLYLCEYEIKLGDMAAAWRSLMEGLGLASRLGARYLELDAVICYARIRADAGELDHAAALLDLALRHPAKSYDIEVSAREALADMGLPVPAETTSAPSRTLPQLDTVTAEILAHFPGSSTPGV